MLIGYDTEKQEIFQKKGERKVKKLLLITLFACCILLTACGETTMDYGNDTDGRAGEPYNNQENNTSGAMDSATEGVGNAVRNAADGVGDAARGVVDGAQGAVDGATAGMEETMNNITGNPQGDSATAER